MKRYISATHCKVGVFDSGIGGLNLLKECVKRIPYADFLYFADNYAVPYGARSDADILNRVDKIFGLMNAIGVDAAVMACNTATAVCINEMRKKYPFIITGIQPAVKQAAMNYERCVVLCTEATARSVSLNDLAARYGRGKTRIVPCPALAAYIESNMPRIEEEEVIKMLPDVDADCIVLGCTHYSYIKNTISERYGLPIFDGMVGTADHLKTLLGICDHFSNYNGKISFVGGNICKNFEIYQQLMKNYDD